MADSDDRGVLVMFESGVPETDGDSENKDLLPPVWTTLGGLSAHGVAIDVELGVAMSTISLGVPAWAHFRRELGGLGLASRLAINNPKYLICNRNHKSQWEHLSHRMH